MRTFIRFFTSVYPLVSDTITLKAEALAAVMARAGEDRGVAGAATGRVQGSDRCVRVFPAS